MKTLGSIILYGALGVSLFFLWDNVLRSPCSRIIEYSIGEFDDRYRISKDEFLDIVQESELVWEDVAQKELFRYVPDADFKINLKWSENQELLYQGDDLENQLDQQQSSIESVQSRYESALQRYETAKREFRQAEESYQRDVDLWNQNPGTQAAYQELKREERALNEQLTALNSLGALVNRLAEQSNQKIDQFNQGVNEFNQLFDGREFDAGNTDGTEINVYSFDGEEELHALLVHEFGHVLGIGHIEDSESVMYYLLNEENSDGNLTNFDIAALEQSCRL